MEAVGLNQVRRQQHVQGLVNYFGGSVSENSLCAIIEKEDVLRLVQGNNAIVGDLKCFCKKGFTDGFSPAFWDVECFDIWMRPA